MDAAGMVKAANYSALTPVTIRTAKSSSATAPTKARKFLIVSNREAFWLVEPSGLAKVEGDGTEAGGAVSGQGPCHWATGF